MKIPLSRPYFTKEEQENVIDVINSGWVMQGEKVDLLEKELSKYIGIKYAILVSSGTAALHLALISLGIGREDEVIVPSFSFVATANSVLYVGAKPVFCDIDPDTYNIDPVEIEKKITSKTKAIIVVHQVGLPADMDKILKIAKDKKLLVIEDAACALGAKYKNKMVGTFGDVSCFSFHPRKNITTGEGGLITTNNKKISDRLRSLRSHGLLKKNKKDQLVSLGYNYRMTDIQAAIGLAQVKKIKTIIQERQKLARKYDKAFKSITKIKPPFVPKDRIHTFQSYLLRITGGRKLRDKIIKEFIKDEIGYSPSISAIHKQKFYKKILGNISLPQTEKANQEGLILPLWTHMTEKEQDFVVKKLISVINNK